MGNSKTFFCTVSIRYKLLRICWSLRKVTESVRATHYQRQFHHLSGPWSLSQEWCLNTETGLIPEARSDPRAQSQEWTPSAEPGRKPQWEVIWPQAKNNKMFQIQPKKSSRFTEKDTKGLGDSLPLRVFNHGWFSVWEPHPWVIGSGA